MVYTTALQLVTTHTTHTPLQLQFVAPTAEEFDLLQRQMKARLSEGQGETIFEIGLGGTFVLVLLYAFFKSGIHILGF